MARNIHLTRVIAGRTATQLKLVQGEAKLRFDDGSVLTVRLGAPPPPEPPLGRVRAVRQRDTTIQFDFEDAPTLTLITAEPTASVLLRDRDQVLEYAD